MAVLVKDLLESIEARGIGAVLFRDDRIFTRHPGEVTLRSRVGCLPVAAMRRDGRSGCRCLYCDICYGAGPLVVVTEGTTLERLPGEIEVLIGLLRERLVESALISPETATPPAEFTRKGDRIGARVSYYGTPLFDFRGGVWMRNIHSVLAPAIAGEAVWSQVRWSFGLKKTCQGMVRLDVQIDFDMSAQDGVYRHLMRSTCDGLADNVPIVRGLDYIGLSGYNRMRVLMQAYCRCYHILAPGQDPVFVCDA